MFSTCNPASVGPEVAPANLLAGVATIGSAGGAGRGFLCGDEPLLDEMMDDPILHRLMASDGVQPDHLMAVIMAARARLAGR